MNVNAKASEAAALIGRVAPISQGAGTVSTAWAPASKFHNFLALVSAGVLGAAATLDAKIEQAQDAAGTGAKDLAPAKAITQLTKAGADDNKEAQINFRAGDLDLDNNYNHVRLTLTVAVAASLVAGYLAGFNPRSGPASDHDIASVDEIVG